MGSLNLHVRESARFDIEVDVGAVGVSVIFGAGEFDLGAEETLLLEKILQILLCFIERRVMIRLPWANGGTARARQKRGQFVLELGLIVRRRAFDGNRSEAGSASQRDAKDNIGNSVCRIHLHLRVYGGLEIAFLAQECDEMVEPSIEVYRIEWRLDWVICHLNQLRIGEAFCTGKLVDAEVDCGFKDEFDAHAVRFRLHVNADVGELTCSLERGGGLIDLVFGKGLSLLLNERRFEL